tara:strand:+ start:44 stop:472 length:429 start_codon:yes stop_codon:yes gene_type:complete
MTDTNWINNPLQTKFQEVLFELHDLKPLASNSAKEVLQNQTDKMEELEKELFPKKPEVKPTEIKDYTVKFDVNIWFDRNFLVQANSQEEAELKAKELMEETENNFYTKVKPFKLPTLDYKNLEEWVFGDAQFRLDTVFVEED